MENCLSYEFMNNFINYTNSSVVSTCRNCSEECNTCSVKSTNCTSCFIDRSLMNSTCILKKCGNLIKEDMEECDDGNAVSGDGCSSLCIIENTYYCNISFYEFSVCGKCASNCSTCSNYEVIDCTSCLNASYFQRPDKSC